MDDELWKKARKRAEDKAGFLFHLAAYVTVNAFLAMLWLTTTGLGTFPWFLIPTFGWGIGLAAHFVAAFVEPNFVDRMTKREYEALRNRPG